jgi:hypothetical protein
MRHPTYGWEVQREPTVGGVLDAGRAIASAFPVELAPIFH